ncbi:MAG: YggT family protein, partial [Desulfuromusa sp.]|nr:YggT family protein [Desulfuromusa sp.]
ALYRLRRLMPFLQAGGFDLSPIALLILLSVVQQVLISFLYQLAN